MQLSPVERFEVICLIVFLTVAYYSRVVLRGKPRRAGLLLGATSLIAAVIIGAGVAPSHYLTALVQFYDFFYPVIFLGLGLWLTMEG